MVKVIRSGFILSAICASAIGTSVKAQSGNASISDDSLRHAVIKAVTAKLQKNHFSPKTIDDTFSAQVWDRYIKSLDPGRYIFLQEDINRLMKFKFLLDDQMTAASTAFFDTAYAVYSLRTKETGVFVEKMLKQPLDLNSKEVFKTDRKDSPFPVNKAEKEKIWTSYLKYSLLKNYLEIESGKNAGSKPGIDPELEKAARTKVATWYRRYFLQQAAAKNVTEKFAQYMNTITLEMDPHTTYTYPTMQDNLGMALTGKYFGLGMELGVGEIDVYIKRLVSGGAALKSGLVKENDRILAISDNTGKLISTDDIAAEDVSGMIRGEKGTDVTMVVKQPGESERTVTIKRDEITETTNKAKSAVIINNGKRIGYIYLPLFYVNSTDSRMPGCSGDIIKEVEKLKDQNVDGIVFDLRGNGGGSLDEVVRMGAAFMPSSYMTFLRSKDDITPYRSPAVQEPYYKGPLVVMVDESSASASEIFAAAIQDYRRGILIGTSSSFGKGTAQSQVNLGKMGDPSKGIPDVSYGSMRLTIQKFYRVNGAATQLRGVTPDVVLIDRAVAGSVMEKDLPEALQYDTLAMSGKLPNLELSDYAAVMAKAKQRVQNNAGLQLIRKNMISIKALQQAPSKLDLVSFRSQYQEISGYEKAIQAAKELKGDTLNVVAAEFTRFNPALMKKEEFQEKLYQEWLQKLSKDMLLSEAVMLMQDMIDNPKK